MPTKERWAKMGEEEKQRYKDATKAHQKANRAYWRELNNTSYLKKVGTLTRCSPLENTPERIAERARDKANLRCTRAKLARFDDELTELVAKEAHDLRKLRNQLTGIEWHVDHIIPLINPHVCGLHIWSNLRVIPKLTNLQKGNNFAVHEES